MPKNIVVFADGTGQEGGKGHNTNVYRIFNMLEDRTPHQVCFYDRGVGTGRIGRLTGLAFGRGFARNVRDGYEFVFRHFQSEDRIYLIGFSRGAATVRSLSSFIHYFGILPQSRPELIDQAWKIYEIENDTERREKADDFIKRHHTMWSKIHFLGCFDTVAALGAPFRGLSVFIDGLPGFRHRFHNFRLSPNVVHAYQALALDDRRRTFHPILWNPLEAEPADADPDDRDTLKCETMKQVWFAGMHTDVGGGYRERKLSDIPLVWMTQMAIERGLLIYPRHEVRIEEDENGTMHDSRGTFWTRLYRRAPRRWDASREDRPIVHESATLRRRNRENQDEPPYRPWILDVPGCEVEPWRRYSE